LDMEHADGKRLDNPFSLLDYPDIKGKSWQLGRFHNSFSHECFLLFYLSSQVAKKFLLEWKDIYQHFQKNNVNAQCLFVLLLVLVFMCVNLKSFVVMIFVLYCRQKSSSEWCSNFLLWAAYSI
jgi:hypothetical protein